MCIKNNCLRSSWNVNISYYTKYSFTSIRYSVIFLKIINTKKTILKNTKKNCDDRNVCIFCSEMLYVTFLPVNFI